MLDFGRASKISIWGKENEMSCLGGSGRAYGFDLQLVVKSSSSSSTSTTTTRSSSSSHQQTSSSTITESSNSPPLAITTRKPRTPRKRPNQTYNEAAALLSTAYPSIFSTQHLLLSKPCKPFSSHGSFPHHYSSDLFLPFRALDSCGFLLQNPLPQKPGFRIDYCKQQAASLSDKSYSSTSSSGEIDSIHDFQGESILQEEIVEEGIDSILGNLSTSHYNMNANQIPIGLGLGGNLDFGMRRGIRAFRRVDNVDWWSFPTVDVHQISPAFNKNLNKKKKKKIKKVEESTPLVTPKSELLLKLNYDAVINAWSDQSSPFADETQCADHTDVSTRLAQIDLFSENGGAREAGVLRYKEKRLTRLFSKKIRYQVRKVNADRRPRMKGRFVRRPHSIKVAKDGGRP